MRLKRKGVQAFQNAGTPFYLILKVEFQINTTLERIATLGKIKFLSCCCIINSKGIVISICEILTPDTDAHLAEINITMRTHHEIHLLAVGIGIIPISLALRIHVQSEGKLS